MESYIEKPKGIEFLGNYLNGEFVIPSKTDHKLLKVSPSDIRDHIFEALSSREHVKDAVYFAKKAFKAWSSLSFKERAAYFIKAKELYQIHQKDLAEVISRETGKPLWESQKEVLGMISKIDVTLNQSMQLIQDQVLTDMPLNVTGRTTYKARGVFAILGPYNFPGHIPNGSLVPAMLVGNTVVFKPSEHTPASGQWIADIFHKAGFPKGVFNLVQGDGQIGQHLVKHSGIDGVLFTGSYQTGLQIKKDTLEDHWKILALEMGGKNASIVFEDADLDKAVYECLVGAFSTTGQRCSCSSRILLHRSLWQAFVDKFLKMAKNLSIGHWSEPVFMGALVSKMAFDKYFHFQNIAEQEGVETLLKARMLKDMDLKCQLSGHYVTPSVHLVKYSNTSVYQNSEIFGPDVAIFVVDDLDEAIDINNSTGYGLVMSIFTKNPDVYEKALKEAKVGLVNWNRATVGANPRMPFGGLGKSGNDRPAGQFTVYACTTPVASLQDQNNLDKSKLLPGITWI